MNDSKVIAWLEGSPTGVELSDSDSSWFVPVELVPGYVAACGEVSRHTVTEFEELIALASAGKGKIGGTVVFGWRDASRLAAGLQPVDSSVRFTEGWASDVSGRTLAWAVHLYALDIAANELSSVSLAAAIAEGARTLCQACGVSAPVAGGLCDPCTEVLTVVRLERARNLAGVKVGGKTRELLVSEWVARLG
jgi:hypothetical protein